MVVKFLRMHSEKDIIPTASDRLFSMHLLQMMLTCWFYRVVTQTLLGRFKSWPMPVEDHTPPDAFHIILDWCRHKKIIITGMTDDMVDLAGLRAVAE